MGGYDSVTRDLYQDRPKQKTLFSGSPISQIRAKTYLYSTNNKRWRLKGRDRVRNASKTI